MAGKWWLCLIFTGICATPVWSQAPQRTAKKKLVEALMQSVNIERDVPYVVNAHERQKLDLYLPKSGGEKRPIVVWVHGGGWRAGSKDRTPALPVLTQGVVVASINYRLSQHAVFPAQIQDCQAAIRWLKGHAEKYRIDPDRMAVWGSSAGGHLVSLLGTASDTDAWEPIGQFRDLSPRVTCVIDWFGPTDFTLLSNAGLPADSPLTQLIGPTDGKAREKYAAASPVTYVSADDAPFLIMQGTKDPLVPQTQSERLAEKLKAAKVPVKLEIIEGAGHGGPEFVDEARRNMIRDFLIQHLKVGR
ncbi:alpha/beta hydrolase fold domain-containing protein [bacterium]|nr:alpha/beta hydrolase fold domain-containing protein [bacterium]